MKKKASLFFSLVCLLATSTAQAWNNEISFGYGTGKELQQDYDNNGFILSGKLYKFSPIDKTLIMTIDGSVSHWHSDTTQNNELTTAAISPAFRAYFLDPSYHFVRPYLGISFGPTYLSAKELGDREQGSHFAFQSTLEVGTEIGNQKHSIDLNLHLAHYCNAGLFAPNEGIDILYIFSIGYQF